MKKILFSAALAAGLTGIAHAEDTQAISFEDLDVNKNDVLSIAEAGNLPEISVQWSMLDINGDGQLSKGEFGAYKAPAPAAGGK